MKQDELQATNHTPKNACVFLAYIQQNRHPANLQVRYNESEGSVDSRDAMEGSAVSRS